MTHYRRTNWSEGWTPIETVARRQGWQIEIAHNPDSARPYCVSFAGSGHYFKTLHETRTYCLGRGWLDHDGQVYREDD